MKFTPLIITAFLSYATILPVMSCTHANGVAGKPQAAAVTDTPTPSAITQITPGALDKRISEGPLQLLDVRTPAEYADGHINDALNINVQADDFLPLAAKALSKDKPVYVYCRSGKRSMDAATRLAKNGYQVVNLTGGILAWQAASLPTVTD